MSVKCKTSEWGCVYHACMSDDCQKAEVTEQGYSYGPGKCENISPGKHCKLSSTKKISPGRAL